MLTNTNYSGHWNGQNIDIYFLSIHPSKFKFRKLFSLLLLSNFIVRFRENDHSSKNDDDDDILENFNRTWIDVSKKEADHFIVINIIFD